MMNGSDKGTYTVGASYPDAGTVVEFVYSYPVLDETDCVITLSIEAKEVFAKKKLSPLEMINQTLKEDARNNASGAAKSANGHAPAAKALTAEEKEARKTDRSLKVLAKAMGVSVDQVRENLGL